MTIRVDHAVIEVAIGNRALANAISQKIQAAISSFGPPPRYPHVRLRTFRRLDTIDVTGKIALVLVTPQNLRRLPSLVDAIRERGALGVQLIWDGEIPARDLAEATIFRILETARATKGKPPVVVAAERSPVRALRALIAARSPS